MNLKKVGAWGVGMYLEMYSEYILSLCNKDTLKKHLWEWTILTTKILLWYKCVIILEII